MFLARMEVKGLAEIMLKKPYKIPNIDSDKTKPTILKLQRNNLKAYADLMI